MKHLTAFASLLVVIGLTFYSFSSLMPSKGSPASVPDTEFSTERALVTLKEIAKAPHFHANAEHTRVRKYLIEQMKEAGLDVEVQKGYVLDLNYGGISTNDSIKKVPAGYKMNQPINIMGRLKGSGNGKALVLLAHYDSAKTPSPGASDAGSGVVTILESLRAFKASGATHTNDIIVLFTDAEEIGLDGAKLFVNNHPWAKDAGLVLNFEARGSGGPSNMILETNGGNANLIEAFVEANPKYPVASSLMYSIYKMLPNDTDSTIFREDGDIDSFFFAFIDDHFDYHTANDTVENLDVETLAHQGSYLLPLLHHFANADLQNLKANEDHVYVNVPLFNMIHYPFSWILPMLVLAVLFFIALVFYGIKKEAFTVKMIGKGFAAMLISLVLCGLIGFYGWKLVEWLYPQYGEIQHGFKYNGHSYVAFFVFLTLAICFSVFRRMSRNLTTTGMYVAPLAFWILINTAVYLFLKGAGYFIVPVFFGLVSLWLLIRQGKPSLLLLALLAAPAIFIFAPLVQFFPVGLGSDHVFISCIFTVLLFGLVYSVFGFYKMNRIITALCLIIAIGFFIEAHASSDFTEERQKPNSLIYYHNADEGTAYWLTYDDILDDWTRGYLGENPEDASKYIEPAAGSKYSTGYSYAAEAPTKDIAEFKVLLTTDTVQNNQRSISFTIKPQRMVNELLLYSDSTNVYSNLRFNGQPAELNEDGRSISNKLDKRFMRYYLGEGDSLKVSFECPEDANYTFTVLEYSFDLLSHPQFTINKRAANMMPKPFVNTDAVLVRRSFSINDLVLQVKDTLNQPPSLIELINE